MAYSSFTSLRDVAQTFGLRIAQDVDLFASVHPVDVGSFLQETLQENLPLALAIHTEKARSELISAPILVELRKRMDHQISLFSGVNLGVDEAQGLTGVCDFIICRSPEQFYITAPILVIFEAKNEDIKGGLGQCVAAMVAARRYNEAENTGITEIYGAVTTGNVWRFVKLEGEAAWVDRREYYIDTVDMILGILLHIVGLPSHARQTAHKPLSPQYCPGHREEDALCAHRAQKHVHFGSHPGHHIGVDP